MTIRHMRIFIQVYQAESITKAAAELHMTQPAVTRSIQEIEHYYGVCLFDRINHRLFRTKAGQEFYAQAFHIVEAFDLMEKGMRDWDEIGTIRMGATITLGTFFLPDLLLEFKEHYPKISVQSTVTNAKNLQDGLLTNQLDIALIEGAVSYCDLHAESFCSDRLVLLLPPGHTLLSKDNIVPSDLIQYPILLREKGSTTRTFVDNFFSLHNLELFPVLESSSPQAIIQAVCRGIGISFLPSHWVRKELEAGALFTREINHASLTRQNYIVWHKNKFLTGSMKEMIALCKTL
ncbi:MAG: LysR family transcriptional regulator [Eubacteriales bacterium]|nr:LysR family transcriptional regulator [Eubacteriales bacterium]